MSKKLLVLILAAAILLPASASAFRFERTWERSFTVGEGAEFILRNVNGDIEVSSWDRDEIEVRAMIEIKGPSKSKAEELYEKIEFLIEEKERYLSIEADLPRVRQVGFLFGNHISITVDYEIRVPVTTDLDLTSVNGDVDAEAVRGRFDIRTTNGSIDLRGMKGTGEVKTVNGGVKCRIVEFPKGGSLDIKTTNGGVRLYLPEGVGGSLEAKTVNGGIDLDIPLSKSIRVKRRSISGVLGDGEGKILVKTTNGGISIE
jgi:DUF4097 and DUF4098 domain-containing protein YvlB